MNRDHRRRLKHRNLQEAARRLKARMENESAAEIEENILNASLAEREKVQQEPSGAARFVEVARIASEMNPGTGTSPTRGG